MNYIIIHVYTCPVILTRLNMFNKFVILFLCYTFASCAAGDILEQWFNAAQTGNLAVIQRLADTVDINAQYENGSTALIIAADFGHDNIVKYLLQLPRININAKNKDGWTALMKAADSDHENIIRLLLTAGIDINAQNKEGNTAIIIATFWSHKTIVTLLLYAGADPNIKNNENKTALDIASITFKPTLAALIDELNLRQWFNAAQTGNLDVIQRLIDRVDINAKNISGETALMLASDTGHENIVRVLAQVPNININARDNYGFTPLMPASREGFDNIVKLLLAKSDIDVNNKSNSGTTALWAAAAWGRESTVKLLLESSRINVNAQDNDGHTPFMVAARNGKKAVVKLLLEAGADPNIKNNAGLTGYDLASPVLKPDLEALINESKTKQSRLFSRLSIELQSLSKI